MAELRPLRSVIYESNGTGSFSRVAGLLIVVVSLAWVTYLVFVNKAIPDLTNVEIFVLSTAGSFYGINRGTATLQPKENDEKPPIP